MYVNGEEITLKSAQSLEAFLLGNAYDVKRVAVEYNGSVVPRADFDKIQLLESDSLEVVCFVGGG